MSTIFKMIGQGVAGRAAQQSYNAQAAQAELAGRSQAIQYKTQAANILRNLNENHCHHYCTGQGLLVELAGLPGHC
jgi:hypothetical protein